MSSGLRQPSFIGIVVVDQRAEDIEHRGPADRARRVEIVGSCALVPVKSIAARRAALSIAMRDADRRAVVHRVGERAVRRARRATRRTASSALSWTWRHIGRDDVEPEMPRPCGAARCAPFSQAAIWAFRSAMFCGRVARRIAAGGEQRAHLRLAEAALRRPAGNCRSARLPPRRVRLSGGIEPGVMPPISA